MALENILSQEIVQKLGWTLLHFIWQAAAVALLLGILPAVLRKSSANVRYLFACAALGLIVLLPIVTLQLVPISMPQPVANIEPPPAPVITPAQPTIEETSPVVVVEHEQPAKLESNVVMPNISWKQRAVERLEPALPYLVAGWLLGVFGLSLWHLGGWARLQRLKKQMVKRVDNSLQTKMNELAARLRVNRVIELVESALVQVPTVIGWLRPVILLPTSALTGLTAEQLEALLAHELAHIRRYDYLANMLQTVVETLGFYHPAVWWISHRIRIERENCCDDLAVSISGDRIRYAKALTSMEEIRASRSGLAVAATGGSLFSRIRRLVCKDSNESSKTSWIPSVITILMIAIIAIPTTLALTDKSDKPDDLLNFILIQNEKARKKFTTVSYTFELQSEATFNLQGENLPARVVQGPRSLQKRISGEEFKKGKWRYSSMEQQDKSAYLQSGRTEEQNRLERAVFNDDYAASWHVGSIYAYQFDHESLSTMSDRSHAHFALQSIDPIEYGFGDEEYTMMGLYRLMKDKTPFKAEKSVSNGRSVYQIKQFSSWMLDPNHPSCVYVIDPERGFLITSFTAHHQDGSISDEYVVEAEKAQGSDIWLPVRIQEKAYRRKSDTTEYLPQLRKTVRITLNDIKVNEPIEDEKFTLMALQLTDKVCLIKETLDGKTVLMLKKDGVWVPSEAISRAEETAKHLNIETKNVEWENIGGIIPPDFNDTKVLIEHINIGSIGQDCEGKVFITCILDSAQSSVRRHRFVLVQKNGNILEPSGYTTFGPENKLQEKFSFNARFLTREIEGFQFQNRPLPLTGIDNSLLQLQQNNSAAVEQEKLVPSGLAPPGRYAIELDGIDDYLLVPDSPSLRLEKPFTVEIWIKTNLPADTSKEYGHWAIISKGFYVGTPRAWVTGFGIVFQRYPEDPSKLHVDYVTANNSGTYSQTYGTTSVLTNGKSDWIHLYHVFDREKYKSAPGHPLVIGKYLIPTARPLMGQIGEIRIWNGARTREQIRRYENAALTGNEPGLAAWWPFEQKEGQFAYDMSGNKNHARLGSSSGIDDADPKWIDLEATPNQAERNTNTPVEGKSPDKSRQGLTLAIVPNVDPSAREPSLTNEEYQQYLNRLARSGPFVESVLVDRFQWFPVKGNIDRFKQLPLSIFKKQAYILLCTQAKYVMVPKIDGRQIWGIENVWISQDNNSRPAVSIQLDEKGAELFYELTKANIGNHLAMCVDGQVLSAPRIETALRKFVMITGNLNTQELLHLVENLQRRLVITRDTENKTQQKQLNDILEKFSDEKTADKSDNNSKSVRVSVESYITAALAGEDKKAAEYAYPDTAVPAQTNDIREILQGQDIKIVAACIGEWNSLAITPIIKADHVRTGSIVFHLKKVISDQKAQWLIDDIDFETLDTIGNEISYFLNNVPDAKMIIINPDTYTQKQTNAPSENDKTLQKQKLESDELPAGWSLKYIDSSDTGGNLAVLKAVPKPIDENDESWKQEKLEFRISSLKGSLIKTILFTEKFQHNQVEVKPGKYLLKYERSWGKTGDNYRIRREFPVDLSRPGTYELQFTPKLGTAEITGSLGGCYSINFEKEDEGPWIRGFAYQYPNKQYTLDGLPPGKYSLSAVTMRSSPNVIVSQAKVTVGAEDKAIVNIVPVPAGNCSLKGNILGRPKNYKTPWPTWPESEGKWYVLIRKPGSGKVGKVEAYEALTMDSLYVVRGQNITQQTQDKASYHIEGLLAGEYTITAIEHPSWGGCTILRQLSKNLILKDSDQAELDFDLRDVPKDYTPAVAETKNLIAGDEGSIEGRIIDIDTGKGISGVQLAAVPRSLQSYYRLTCTSEKDGKFTIGGLQSGEYLIRGDFPSVDVDVVSGRCTRDVLIGVNRRKTPLTIEEESIARSRYDNVQILIDARVFEIPVDEARDIFEPNESFSNGILMRNGHEIVYRLLALTQEHKEARLIASPQVITLSGREVSTSIGDNKSYTLGPDSTGASGSLTLRMQSLLTGNDISDRILHLKLSVGQKEPVLEPDKDAKSYEDQASLRGRYFSIEGTARNNESIIIGNLRPGKPALCLAITQSALVPERQPVSLIGKKLPEPDNIQNIDSFKQTEGKSILVCFWDSQQRPSRNFISELAKREKELSEKNIAVYLVHTSKTEPAKLKGWLDNRNIPFICGSIKDNADDVLFRWGVRAQPWLILTDQNGLVCAEGFSLEQLDEILQEKVVSNQEVLKVVNTNEDMIRILSDPRASQFQMTWHGGGSGRREGMAVEPSCLRVYEVQIVDNPSSEAIELAGPQAKYGRIEFADFSQTKFTCGLTKSSEQNADPDIFFIDLNHNGQLEKDEFHKGVSIYENLDKIHYGFIDIPLRDQNQSRLHRAFVWYGKYDDLYLVSHCYMQGRIRLSDKEFTAVLVDYNCDGRYCSGVTIDGHWETLGPAGRDYDRIGWDADGDGKIQSSEQHFIGSYLVCDGGIYRVGCTPDGRTVAVVPVKVPTGRLLMPTKNAFVRLVGNAGPMNLRITDGAVDVPDGTYRVDYLYIEELDNDGKATRLSKSGRYFDKPWDIPAGVTTEISRDKCIITDRDKRNYEARMRELRGEGPQPRIASLLDEPLRSLDEFNIDLDLEKLKGRRIVVCFWDMDQRPSRNVVGELAKRAQELQNKGIMVLLVHTMDMEPAKLKEWLDKNKIPFACGRIKSDAKKVLYRWGMQAQPWLILTDEEGIVRAEGFSLEQLDEKLEGNKELGSTNNSETSGTRAAQIHCVGKVVDEQSRPIADARVTLHVFVYGLTSSSFDTNREQEVTTGIDGAFSFSATSETDDYWAGYIVAERQGMALGIGNWEPREGSKKLEIKLCQPKELAGMVVDESGQPVSGAQVSISRLKIVEGEEKRSIFGSLAEELFKSTTDTAGKFAFTSLPANATAEFIIKKTGKGTVSTYRRTADGLEKLNFTSGQTSIKLALPDESRIEGIAVEKQSGKPVAGVKLELNGAAHNRPYHETFESEDDGTFSIGSLTQGRYIVDLVPSREALSEWAADPIELYVETGKTESGVKIELSKGGALEVVVTDAASKKPVEKALVALVNKVNSQHHYSASDKDGIARIRLMPEKYQISYIHKQDYIRREPRDLVSVEDGKTKRFEYELAFMPKITGIVRDEQDNPIEGVKLGFLPGGLQDSTSNAEGKFVINWDSQRRGSGDINVYLMARHKQRNLAAIVELDKYVGTLDIKLKPGVILFGKVVDPKGKSITGAWTMPSLRLPMVGFSMGRPSQKSDTEGNFEIKAMPAGYKYVISVSADGYGRKSSMEIQTDDTASDSRFDVGIITLPIANLSVSGVVVDVNGKPVPGVVVNGYDDIPQADRTTFTNEDGKFTLEKVCAGPIHIIADRGGAKPLSGSRTTRGGAKNVRIVVSQRPVATESEPKHTPPPSLIGKPLPEFQDIGISVRSDDIEDRKILLCFWDMEQRPSRNFIDELAAKREKELTQKNIAVYLVHTSKTEPAKLKEWLDNHDIPFPCGSINNDAEKVLFNWGVRAQPWLILTDQNGLVCAEGFSLEQLDEKLQESIGSNEVVLKLVDPNSQPVVGAQVGTYVDWSDIAENPPVWFLRYGRNHIAAEIKSDEHGKVTLEADEIFGSGQPAKEIAPITAIDEGHYLVGLREMSRKDLGKEVTLMLQPGCRIRGRLTATAARMRKWSPKILTVYVHWYAHRPCGYSSKQGRFEFVLPPSKYQIQVYSDDPDKDLILPILIKPGQRNLDLTKYLDGTSKPPAVQADIMVDTGDSAGAAQKPRIVHFPDDRTVGNLKVRDTRPDIDWDRGYLSRPGWALLGPTRGDVSVPAEEDLRLEVLGDVTDFSFLSDLKPNDLQVLILSNKKISDEDLIHLKGLTGLLALSLDTTPIEDAGLAHLAALTSLTDLSLFNTKVSDAGLEHLSSLKSLKRLSLFITQVRGPGLKCLQNLTSLVLLDLAATPITDESLVHVAEITWLKELQLQDTDITNKGLTHLKSLRSLEMLILGNTNLKQGHSPITDDGLVYLKGLDSLKDLHLLRTRVTDAGLAYLSNLKTLEYLDLKETRLTGEGLAYLKDLPVLTYLNLEKTGVTEVGLKYLKEMSNLRVLLLDGENINEKDLKDLEKALPDCKVTVRTANSAGNDLQTPLLAKSPALPAGDKSIVRVDLSVIEMFSDSKMDKKTIIEIKNLLGGKITIPASPAVADLLKKAAKATAAVKDESAGDKRVTQMEFNTLFDLLVSRGYVKILMRPTLEVADGQTAKIASSQNIPSRQEPLEDLIQITPHVSKDGNIILQVKAILNFKSARQDNEQTTIINTHEIATLFRLSPGESGIIGGTQQTGFITKPGKDVKDSEGPDTEILVILTPTIVDTTSNRFETRVFQLKYADPDMIKERIEGSYKYPANKPQETVRVTAFPTTKEVTVIASPENLSRIAEQIAEWDTFQVFKPRIIELKNSDPVQMARLLTTLFAEEGRDEVNIRNVILGVDITGPLSSHFIFEDVPETSKIIVMSNIPKAYDAVGQLILELDKEKMVTKDIKQVREWIAGLVKEGRLGVPKTIDEAEQSEKQKKPMETVNFQNAEAKTVIETLAEWTGKTIISTDELMKQSITVFSPQQMPRSEAIELILNSLRSKGYTAEQTDDTIYLKPVTEEQFSTDKNQIMIDTKILTVSDEFLKTVGLDPNSLEGTGWWSENLLFNHGFSEPCEPIALTFDEHTVDMLLKELPSRKDCKLLSHQKILATEGKQTEIPVVSQAYFIEVAYDPNKPSEAPTARTGKLQFGTFIRLTPELMPGTDKIAMDLEKEVRLLKDFDKDKYKGKHPEEIPPYSWSKTKGKIVISDGDTLPIVGQRIPEPVLLAEQEALQQEALWSNINPIKAAFWKSSFTEKPDRILILIKPKVPRK